MENSKHETYPMSSDIYKTYAFRYTSKKIVPQFTMQADVIYKNGKEQTKTMPLSQKVKQSYVKRRVNCMPITRNVLFSFGQFTDEIRFVKLVALREFLKKKYMKRTSGIGDGELNWELSMGWQQS